MVCHLRTGLVRAGDQLTTNRKEQNPTGEGIFLVAVKQKPALELTHTPFTWMSETLSHVLEQSSWSAKLTSHLRVLQLRMRGASPPVSLSAFTVWCLGTVTSLYLESVIRLSLSPSVV
jgi:hypothetical protein